MMTPDTEERDAVCLANSGHEGLQESSHWVHRRTEIVGARRAIWASPVTGSKIGISASGAFSYFCRLRESK